MAYGLRKANWAKKSIALPDRRRSFQVAVPAAYSRLQQAESDADRDYYRNQLRRMLHTLRQHDPDNALLDSEYFKGIDPIDDEQKA